MPPGYDPTAAQERIQRDAEAAAERRAAELLRAAGLPKRHSDPVIRRSTTCPREWLSKLETIEGKLSNGFLIALMGDRGTGKTQLAAEVVRTCCGMGGPSRYCRALEFFMAIKEAYRGDGPTERQRLDAFYRPSLLVIDEAQERGETDWENRLLTHLIDVRYAEMRDTLLISNLKPEAFKASIGPSIYSRLVETGGEIVCDWPSFRRPGGAA